MDEDLPTTELVHDHQASSSGSSKGGSSLGELERERENPFGEYSNLSMYTWLTLTTAHVPRQKR
jgi:hypothetical protein